MTIGVSIIGGSGYTGGELTRLLLSHPEVEINQITSRSLATKPITRVNPNLRGKTNLKFSSPGDLEDTDLLFLCLPHGVSSGSFDDYKDKSSKIIDLSSDFRLHSSTLYSRYYGEFKGSKEILDKFIYGIAEINRDKIKSANYVATAGCNATATILGLYPLISNDIMIDKIIVDAKVGSSEGGREFSSATHHPERSGSMRSYRPTSHRHAAEVIEYLGLSPESVHFTATSVEMVRGAMATIHCFVENSLDDKELWKLFRQTYKNEPFVRIVKELTGNYRMPDPKTVTGTNFCDVGFEVEEDTNRIVIISALDNLMKGAAGQAIQAMNLMMGYTETSGLEFMGLHPV